MKERFVYEAVIGEKAVVTGGTRGIGLGTVKALVEAGAEVVFTGQSAESAEAATREIGALATGVVCDMRDTVGLKAVFAGGCDVLVNNAAVARPWGKLHEIKHDDLCAAIDINLIGAISAACEAIQQMLAVGGGTIINISSGAAHFPLPNSGAYCISKAGLFMATKMLHAEYGELGIRVFGLRPGVVNTDMQTELRESGYFDDVAADPSKLFPPEVPGRIVRWLITEAPDSFVGRDLSFLDEDFRKAMEALD